MVTPLVVIDVVGLTHAMLGPDTPCLQQLAHEGFARPMSTVLPAVTCTAQSTILTGLTPSGHGVVANGWYFRDLSEVWFWRQCNRLVHGEKLYETAKRRDPHYTTAKMFWWYNMYAPVDWSLTPRPSYPADGRKLPDTYSEPEGLRDELQEKLGQFPLFKFWGPGADITSTRWIADASVEVFKKHRPSLTLAYLPHLDYDLQRFGPADPRISKAIREVDAEAGKLIRAAKEAGAHVVVLSEYAITPVSHPVHINRVLRTAGWLRVRREPLGWETLDCGASRAFAVSDHQVAHVYVRDPKDIPQVAELLRGTDGIEQVLDAEAQRVAGIHHERAGELVAVAAPESWFTYYFWLNDSVAPDYARSVDIHRKPGYDPVELLLDPKLRWPVLKIAQRLAQKKLGFRYYMDVIGLDASIVKGSHGRLPAPGREAEDGPVFISSSRSIETDQVLMTSVKDMLLKLQFGN